MSKAPEASGIAPSDGWFGYDHGDIVHCKTEISVAAPAPGAAPDEVASDYRNLLQANYYDGGPAGGYNQGPPPSSYQQGTNADPEAPETPMPMCYCGQPCTRLLSRSAANPNRWFLKCPKYKDDPTQCKFFVWEDQLDSKSPLAPPATRRRVDNNTIVVGGGHSAPPVAPYAPYVAAPGGALPEGGRDRSNDECFHCGGKGHWSSECTVPKAGINNVGAGSVGGGSAPAAPGTGGGAGGNTNTTFTCYKCGQEGHYARDCVNKPAAPAYNSQQTAGGGGGGGGGASRGTCFKCGEEGHWSRDCPNQGGGGASRGGTYGSGPYGGSTGGGGGGGGYAGGGGGGGAPRGSCFKCGGEGHWSRDCPNQGGGGGGAGGVKRRYEGGAGYDTNAYGGGGYGAYSGYGGSGGGAAAAKGSCYKCGGSGHWSNNCPNK